MGSTALSPALEMAHVLFMDIVAYSTLPMDQQQRVLCTLQETTSANSEFVSAQNSDQLIRLPTGDGMALVFFGNPEAPARCALALSKRLQQHPEIKLRMGLHTGPVYRVADINANRNVAGGGINVAQRVMDCGDAGHILVSKTLADVLVQITGWKNSLKDLGDAKVKHGFRVQLFNLYTGEVGNPKVPKKLRRASLHRMATWSTALIMVMILMLLSQAWPTHGSPRSTSLVVNNAVFQIRREIKSLLGTPKVPSERQIAVLPASMPNDDPETSALERGLAETLAGRLTQLTASHSLQVIPASEVTAAGITTLQQAQEEFGVTLGLELSLRRSGEMVRVNYSLIDAGSHRQINGGSITAQLSDTFAIEDQVTENVLRSLELDLQPEERRLLTVHSTNKPSAYSNYVEGRGYLQDYSKAENVENAISIMRQALNEDPGFAMARAALGEAYWRKYSLTKDQQWATLAQKECTDAAQIGNAGSSGHMCLGLVDDGTGNYKDAVVEYERAVALEPTMESAYIGLALAYEHQGAVADAERTYQKVLDAHPRSWESLNSTGTFYYRQGQYDKAAELFRRVTELAPQGFAGYVNLGATLNNTGRFADAIQPLNQAIALRPVFAAYTNLGNAYFGLHEYTEAAEVYQQAIKLSPGQYIAWGNLGIAQYYGGHRSLSTEAFQRAMRMANEELEVNPHDAYVLGDVASYYALLGDRQHALSALHASLEYEGMNNEIIFNAADVYNQLGETSLALDWLTKAVGAGYSVDKFRDSPAFKNLEANPRYRALVGKQHTL